MDLGQLIYSIKEDPIRNEELLQFIGFCLQHAHHSESQNYQDVWALWETKSKRQGFFVEFGATDGKTSSNTYLLEEQFGWGGILAEPNPTWHEELAKNRNALISHDCVYTETGQTLEFLKTDAADLATIKGFGNDEFSEERKKSETISVNTISLYDLLDYNGAPEVIDYLSIDTEGSEYGILNAFFQKNNKYDVKCITVEHNFTMRDKLHELLTTNGYVRKFEQISRWDDFYVKVK
jgi:FkbM family methyltransferase